MSVIRIGAAVAIAAGIAAALYVTTRPGESGPEAPVQAEDGAPAAAAPAAAAAAAAPAMSDPAEAPQPEPAETAMDGSDPYLWLEEVEGKRALDWVRARNAESLAELQADPRFAGFRDAMYAILTATDRIAYGSYRDGSVWNFWQDQTHVRGLWRRATLESYLSDTPEWEVLLDIDALNAAEGASWVFRGANCLEPAGTRCLITLSPGGTDASVIREFDLETRGFVADGFTVDVAKTAAGWLDQDTLLIGSDFGEGSLTTSGYPRVVKRWARGTALADAPVISEGEMADVGHWPFVLVRPEGTHAFVNRAVTFFESDVFHIAPDGTRTQLPIQRSAELQGLFKGQVLLKLREAWTLTAPDGTVETLPQGALVAFPLADLLETGTLPWVSIVYAPDERTAMQGVASGGEKLYIQLLQNVTGKVLAADFADDTWTLSEVDLPGNVSVAIQGVDGFGSIAAFNVEGFTTPDTLFLTQATGVAPEPVKALPARFDAAGLTVTQKEIASKDGTMIPYFVVRPANATGPLPTLLYGYGGFEISQEPWYWTTGGKLWLERGGAIAVANIRGGGEFGPRWHEAALRTNRQRSWDDFQAVAKALSDTGVTTPAQLGIMGGSQGGLLMGVTMTQAPELIGAVVIQVPLLDMIRYVDLPPGASWIAEYGNPEVPDERAALEAWSPYHNLSAGKTYPRPFIVTSTKDDRVHPGHARKFAARMMEMGKPVLYYEKIEGGHSAAADLKQAAERIALEWTYLSRELGLE